MSESGVISEPLAHDFVLPKWHSEQQRQIILDPRNIVCFAGRQVGKTEAAVNRMFAQSMICGKPGLYWWVGYSWSSASMKRAWRLMKQRATQLWEAAGGAPSRYIRESRKEILLPNGIEFWLRTSLHPESLVGEGVRGVVLDEFPLMAAEVWEDHIEPCLLRYNGWALFTGVPEGRAWSSDLFDYAKSGVDKNWIAITMTTYDNPYIDPKVIDAKRMRLCRTPAGDAIFRQRYLAQVQEDLTAMFTREAIEQCMDKFTIEWPRKGNREYFAAVDPAGGGMDEFTMAIGHPEKKRIVVDAIRGHQVRSNMNTDAIVSEYAALCKRYGVRVIYGDAYAGKWPHDRFEAYGIQYEKIPVTASEMYLEAMPMFACRQIMMPKEFQTKQQFLSLQRRQSMGRGGKSVNARWIITHPHGGHDDRANVVTILAYGLKNTLTGEGGGYYFGN